MATPITPTTADQQQQKAAVVASPCISEHDMANVRKLRELIKDQLTSYYDTDFNLLRWLHGHNNNFDEIVPKLKNHLAMRRSHFKLDTIADGPRNHPVHAYWEAGLTCEAGHTPNCLVNIEQSGTNDYWGILHAFPLNEILKARIFDLERMLQMVMAKERETGRQHSVMYIMDLTGLKYDRHLMTLLRGALGSISAFMSEHYVELIHSFVLVNVPHFISIIWSIAKPLLPERTRHKVNILSAGASWHHEILKMARPEALPTFWNEPGKEKVFLADLRRSAQVDPSKYYKPDPSQQCASTLLTIGPGRCSHVDVQAEKGQTLWWRFDTNGHFSFALYLVDEQQQQQQSEAKTATNDAKHWQLVYPRFPLVPGPTYVPVHDQFVCEQSGQYRLWFSNEHAWLHSLKITYEIGKE